MPHHEAAERQLRFLEIDQTTIDSLQQLKDSLEAGIEEHLDEFYAHILEQPELRSLFSDKESIARARASQGRYWLKHMFAKRFDRGQFEQAEEIASAHLRVGLEPSWYMSSYCWMLNRFVEQSRACHGSDIEQMSAAIQALNKLVFLDMTIVTGIYLEAKNASMRELLRRATIFAEDMTALSGGVEAAHQDLQAKVDSAAERTEVAASVTALSERVKELTSRLDKFRTVDRLETTHHRVSEGWIARARRFVDERLQGRA